MRTIRVFAALAGFLGVGFGAFGAHALDAILTDRGRDLWDTATLYALVHAVAAYGAPGKAPAIALLVGVGLFAGSLYALALGAPSWIGAITPLGGLSLLAGWGLMGRAALTNRPSPGGH